MMPPAKRKPVDARVVEVDHPLPADIVHDRTNSWRTRLPIIALILLVLYIVISGLIQSAQNGNQLKETSDQLDKATASISQLTQSQARLLKTVKRDEGFVLLSAAAVKDLRKVVKEQNKLLAAAGLPTQSLPKFPTAPSTSQTSTQAPTQTPQSPSGSQGHPQPSHQPQPSHHPTPSPDPRPTHKPKPKPTTCQLKNPLGGCLIPSPKVKITL